MKGDTVVSAKGLVKRFGDVTAVDGIDLDTPADVMKALLRHPGMAASGAWTLLRCLI